MAAISPCVTTKLPVSVRAAAISAAVIPVSWFIVIVVPPVTVIPDSMLLADAR